jgi:hypothetical protein
MRIVDVRAIPLRGRVSEGGWEETLDPDENSHTLVQVLTDQGLSGVGSAYTSLALVEGALTAGVLPCRPVTRDADDAG